MSKSQNDYDWLGNGFYFWENNYERAMQWAQEKMARNPDKVTNPSVLGAFIDLGYCLDLIDSRYLERLSYAHSILNDICRTRNITLPENSGGKDRLFRRLDCAVIETLHQYNKDEGKQSFDSVRGVFWEGDDLYLNAGFKEKNHIQICLRNPNCIKGFFIPRIIDSGYAMP